MQKYNPKLKFIFLAILFFAFFGWAEKSWAGTFWVSSTGAATWNNCQSATPLSDSEACAYAIANANAVAGDTVYFRAGTYSGITGNAIDPSHSGAADNKITFSAYNNEDVQFVGSGLNSMAVDLDSEYGTIRSYIKVHDLHFTNFMKHLWIRKGGHNEISHCSFSGFPPEATTTDIQNVWSASYIYRQAQYNWIHHSSFGNWGACEPFGSDVGVVIQIGLETSLDDFTKYNIFENNTAYHGGHHVVSLNGTNNVYRNNYFYNDPWCPIGNPQYSTRIMFQTGADGDGKRNLVEGNRFGYGGPKNKDEIGGAGGTLAGAYNIWRKNIFIQIYTDALWMNKYSGQSDVIHNKVYNNTFWHGGYGEYQMKPGGAVPSNNWEWEYTHGIDVAEGDGSAVFDNVFKNNLFYQNRDYYGAAYSIIKHGRTIYGLKLPEHQILSNNWFDNEGDPKFVDISGTPDPTNGSQWDFNLRSDSPCRDSGAFLTTITSASGSGTSFAVADAGYFFDGWGIGAQVPDAGIIGDSVQLEGQTQSATITAVDYVDNIVTVDTSLNWTQNKGVALRYGGESPDAGAFEFVSGGDVTSPAAPSGLAVN